MSNNEFSTASSSATMCHLHPVLSMLRYFLSCLLIFPLVFEAVHLFSGLFVLQTVYVLQGTGARQRCHVLREIVPKKKKKTD